tara:strand:- start:72 stop:374 length:303 start_codon:yes stop_codon:yes gene_type:complete
MKDFLLRFHHNFIIGGFGYNNSSRLIKLIYFLTLMGFLTIGDFIFEYGFLESFSNFFDIFFNEKMSYIIFFLLMIFLVGGMIYTPFFIFAFIKAIISKKM